ncbi:glucoside xylosyltransferase 2-like isoform X1 [Anguilla rostrata]|uniref:glucoside xylosyltransferase 2-like isoform X1 n=1 Tax=Anguilla rostrata TaxID=7938 RepID=UPI0030CECCB1
MRTHGKILAIFLCAALSALLYFYAGNAADERSLKQAWVGSSAALKGGNAAPADSAKTPQQAAQGQPRLNWQGIKLLTQPTSMHAKPRVRTEWGRALPRGPIIGETMHLAAVVCGDRVEEAFTMLKSALIFSLKRIKFHIFTEHALATVFDKGLKRWPRFLSPRFQYSIYPITFSAENAEEWKNLFKPCAAQRLFLPVLLKDVDSLLYVDTDVLFLRPMDHIWSILKDFNSTQLAGMAPDHEIPKTGWYSRYARHPFYGAAGLNSGVMLMNLTRIRGTLFKSSLIPTGLSWEDLLQPLYEKYKDLIAWGDQDLLNIIFHYNPEYLYTFPCQWNYRPEHCAYGSNCKGAEEEGVSILHGIRRVYHDDKHPAFKAIYDVVRKYPLEDNMAHALFEPLQSKFLDTVNTLCGRIPQIFLKQVEKTMRTMFEQRLIVPTKPQPK